MPKGYMVFLEGGECPRLVHRKQQTAWEMMHQLAVENPGKEVMLMNLSRRFMFVAGTERAESIGSHLPNDLRPMVGTDQLITHDKIIKCI